MKAFYYAEKEKGEFIKQTFEKHHWLNNTKLHYMALQLTIHDASNTAWFKKSSVKMTCLFVAGLLFTAMLYNRSSSNNTGRQTTIPVCQQVSSNTCNNTNAKVIQCKEPQSFSLIPGGFSRFLQ